jgi:hypothetical protein
MVSLNIPNFNTGLYYYSLEANVSSGNISANGVFGASYAGNNGPLVSYMTYFNASSNWAGALNPAGADVSKASSFVGSAYLALEEFIGDVNSNMTIIKSTQLQNLQWNVSQVTSISTVKYATFIGRDVNQPNFSMSFTFVISNSSATLSTGAQLTPKSVECVINVLNYNFTSNKSALALLVGVATAAMGNVSNLTTIGDYHRMVAGNGVGGVYWDGSTMVYTNNNSDTDKVTINSTVSNSTAMGGASFVNQCNQIKQAQPTINVTYTMIRIAFPQAANLTYDPSIGVDAFPNGTVVGGKGKNMASLTSVPFVALLIYIFTTVVLIRVV